MSDQENKTSPAPAQNGRKSRASRQKQDPWQRRASIATVAGTLIALLTLTFGDKLWQQWRDREKTPAPVPLVETTMITNFIHVDLPSTYADADVTADGKPADVIDRTLTSQTLRVVTTEGQHQFHFQKGSVSRDLSQFLSASQTNVALTPFSN